MSIHIPVLLKEAIDALNLEGGETVIDGTLGSGGHSLEICRRFGDSVKILALDLDIDSISRAKEKLAEMNCNITYHNLNFVDFDKALGEENISKVDGILLDLGYSTDQLKESGRGLSFQKDEPLKMTLKKSITENEFDAYDIVNNWKEEDIANVIYAYGEERFARRIAREIVEKREKTPINTTTELVNIVKDAVPFFYKKGRLNPATKTFQALRIAVNNELENLKKILEKGFESLESGGRISVISFHSLEDRIVKHYFRELAKDEKALLVTKKPIIPTEEEVKDNPKSRSAKLRIIQKI